MKPYDWEADPGCSWLRHPAGRRRPVQQVDVEFSAPWWWYVVCVVAVVGTIQAAEFFLRN